MGPRSLALLAGSFSAALYAALPFAGERKWDALMTASVLAQPERVSANEVFFFAHPLVIPLTVPFGWAFDDPLVAAAMREAFFGGLVVAIATLVTAVATGSRKAGLLSAAILTLAGSRWQLATGGEEKEVALAFAAAFVALLLDHRGLLTLPLGAGWHARPWLRRGVLSSLLALAIAVHLVNGLLVGVLLADVALDAGRRRAALREALLLLGGAGLLVGPFFLWLAVGPGGARSAFGVAAHFLEYHLSGEFLSRPASLVGRLAEAAGGGRTWLLGGQPLRASYLEATLLAALAVALGARARAVAPAVVARLFAWIALLAAHFLFYEPWDPEAWGPAGFAWAVVAAVGWTAPGRGRRVRFAVAAAGALALAALDGRALLAARREAAKAAGFAEGAPAPAPLADVARWVDAAIEPDALLVVSHRHLASYFHIYTRREPLVRDYLDLGGEELRRRYLLTTLSLRFYAPSLSSAQLRQAVGEGRPVYLLTDEDEALKGERRLGYAGLRLGRWLPPG